MWDFDRLLAAATATATSDLRWLEAVGRVGEDELPDHWHMKIYGPPDPEVESSDSEASRSEQGAREVAAAMRG